MPPPISAIKEAAAAAAVVRNAGRRAHRRWIPPSEELTIRNPTSSRPTHRKQLHQTYKFSRIFTQFSTTTRQVKMKFMVQPRINGIPMTLFVAAIVLLTVAQLSSASPMIPNYFDYDMHQKQNVQAPDFTKAGIQSTLEYLQNALNALNLENTKRGIDLGLGRGFSGSQAAKHLMGLAAANFAGGPGRRRRAAPVASMRDDLDV
ncbi:uncharacterized protein Dh31 isoform X1 [Atheta coriaria]|uniref:uncharacterized protein Dh31 isoform X1 n=1 Tax=Dalotia coriaria TaxID=877792 RepID=UPI0031F427B0